MLLKTKAVLKIPFISLTNLMVLVDGIRFEKMCHQSLLYRIKHRTRRSIYSRLGAILERLHIVSNVAEVKRQQRHFGSGGNQDRQSFINNLPNRNSKDY